MMRQILLLFFVIPYLSIYAAFSPIQTHEKPFVFIVPSYNNARWYVKNLASIFMQKYSNYRVIYIDDCSPDGTAYLVSKYVDHRKQRHRFTLISNKKRSLQLANRYRAIHSCKDDEIMIMLDGDDFLAHENVLTLLNAAYQDENMWAVYAQFLYWCNSCRSKPLSQRKSGHKIKCRHTAGLPWNETLETRNLSRTAQEVRAEHSGPLKGGPIHLRTFYAGLFKNIALKDLMYEGGFLPRSTEVATHFPLIEMAHGHIGFVPEVCLELNRQNPLNVQKVYRTDPVQRKFEQMSFRSEITARAAYNSIDRCVGPTTRTCGKVAIIITGDEVSGKIIGNFGTHEGYVLSRSSNSGKIQKCLDQSSAEYFLFSSNDIPTGSEIEQAVHDMQSTHSSIHLLNNKCLRETHHVDLWKDLHAAQMLSIDAADFMSTSVLLRRDMVCSMLENDSTQTFEDVLKNSVGRSLAPTDVVLFSAE